MRRYERWLLDRGVERILRTIDLKTFKIYQTRYANASPPPGYSKYLNVEHWLRHNLQYVFRLNLHTSKPLRILDIGSGCGYFPYACQCYGHSVTLLDLDLVPMYNEIVSFLKLDRRVFEIRAFERLPDFGRRFDLVTAFMVCFNQHNKPDLWGSEQWDFFLTDLAANQLSRVGRVFLNLNAEKSGEYCSNELRGFFLRYGAQVNRGEVYFPTMACFTTGLSELVAKS